jgi:hypothetical protein
MRSLLAVSLKNEGTETNLLYFYILRLDFGKMLAYFDLIKSFSAYSLQRDTFKVTKLMMIKKSRILFALLSDYGALMINATDIY